MNYKQLESLCSTLCEYLGCEYSELRHRCRRKEMVQPRYQILSFLHSKKHLMRFNDTQLGKLFGLNRATVIHASKSLEKDCNSDKEFAKRHDEFIGQATSLLLKVLAGNSEAIGFSEEYEFNCKYAL